MRKLIFHFFITKDWRENNAYNVHFNCLEYYKNCFDEVYFALSTEDPSDKESLFEVRNKLFEIFKYTKRVEFETLENTPYGEVTTFKKEIIDKLGQNEIVFFAHTKGVTDVKRHQMDPDWVYKIISGLYYFSLERAYSKNGETDDVTEALNISTDAISYGSYLVQFTYEPKLKNTYEWYYAGTFFWINTKRLKQWMRLNEVELPQILDRYYAENFLGEIYPIDGGSILAKSYRDRYIYQGFANRVNLDLFIDFCTEDEREVFDNFVENMKKI